ncbi:MAG: hypothetical protein HC893_15280 [Chloroflexaceae bacterium]|nr:hypothetical protein [Chloroflexaceae bacterium]
MTVEAWTRTPEYPVSGIGPYTITHPYAEDAISVSVRLTTGELLPLSLADFSVTPTSSDTEGDVYLTSLAATTHAGHLRDDALDARVVPRDPRHQPARIAELVAVE